MKKQINLSLIKKKRLELGFSNEDMANSLGLASPDKYFRREHGTYKFQAAELPALSKKLEIPLEKIFI
ncbi:helix-turn-helix domain-containing protein [Lactobacillus crispatus]|uniref:helix-turn-helix domain-containing protein n=1 Tax=Lactobacillus crispatus TaxID=47770 RepID=UPI00103E9112|nr:helix-turn-helix transcriptional regulator [Lactobacillus crispatus]MBW0437234.1 helix-turn-helix transcriptional regulator [Lactobacillus crispatus]MBW0443719.1 helix-turn-helix transcriptional regulator [Lactobacillus crispatus]MBW0455831.1 helix-turn-helix transcriptional regulator [Lactobacillus crispatus]QLK33405.1 helix-turn-helix transcriptional regulator [Lactobacillus crispatus]